MPGMNQVVQINEDIVSSEVRPRLATEMLLKIIGTGNRMTVFEGRNKSGETEVI